MAFPAPDPKPLKLSRPHGAFLSRRVPAATSIGVEPAAFRFVLIHHYSTCVADAASRATSDAPLDRRCLCFFSRPGKRLASFSPSHSASSYLDSFPVLSSLPRWRGQGTKSLLVGFRAIHLPSCRTNTSRTSCTADTADVKLLLVFISMTILIYFYSSLILVFMRSSQRSTLFFLFQKPKVASNHAWGLKRSMWRHFYLFLLSALLHAGNTSCRRLDDRFDAAQRR